MEKTLIRSCECCGGTRGVVLHHTRFTLIEDIPLADAYDVVACTACGACFADTPSEQADYDRYYQLHSKYEDAATSTGSSLSPLDAARIRAQAEHIASVMPDRNLRILDIGCANGGLLSALYELGYRNLTGIDPSPACARNVSAREGITGIAGTFSALPALDTRFDLIILTGVMEHLRDLAGSIRGFTQLLAPGGHVYLAVPDAARYHLYIQAPLQDFNTEHINHFSMTSLANLMQRHGYTTVTTGQQLSRESAAMDTPILFGLYRHTANAVPFVRDDTLADALRSYIEDSHKLMDRLAAQLNRHLQAHASVIVWGTGQLTFKMLALAGDHVRSISAFVDGNPINQGRRLLGKPILAPKAIADNPAPIVIMTTLHHAAIEQNIRTLGLPNPILSLM